MQLIAKGVAVKAFTQVSELVLLATPVLTGMARRNWIPSIDDPVTAPVDEVFGGTTTGEPLTTEEQTRLTEIVKQFSEGSGTKLFLSNNLDYIENLDQGSSKKAPAGIVLPSITAALQVLQDEGVQRGKV